MIDQEQLIHDLTMVTLMKSDFEIGDPLHFDSACQKILEKYNEISTLYRLRLEKEQRN